MYEERNESLPHAAQGQGASLLVPHIDRRHTRFCACSSRHSRRFQVYPASRGPPPPDRFRPRSVGYPRHTPTAARLQSVLANNRLPAGLGPRLQSLPVIGEHPLRSAFVFVSVFLFLSRSPASFTSHQF